MGALPELSARRNLAYDIRSGWPAHLSSPTPGPQKTHAEAPALTTPISKTKRGGPGARYITTPAISPAGTRSATARAPPSPISHHPKFRLS